MTSHTNLSSLQFQCELWVPTLEMFVEVRRVASLGRECYIVCTMAVRHLRLCLLFRLRIQNNSKSNFQHQASSGSLCELMVQSCYYQTKQGRHPPCCRLLSHKHKHTHTRVLEARRQHYFFLPEEGVLTSIIPLKTSEFENRVNLTLAAAAAGTVILRYYRDSRQQRGLRKLVPQAP